MPRETVKARNARVADLLFRYDEAVTALRKWETEVEQLKNEVREIDPGTYGDWYRGDGTPRVIMDQKAVKADYDKRNVEVPTMTTKPPLVVRKAK